MTLELGFLQAVLRDDGPLRFLLFKADAKGLDGGERFVATSIKYGHSAVGRDKDESLTRALTQVVAYLNRSQGQTSEQRLNVAPDDVCRAFLQLPARPYRAGNQSIRDFIRAFAEVREEKDDGEFAAALLDVNDVSHLQTRGQPLDEVLNERLCAAC